MDWIPFVITGEETKFDLVLPTFTLTAQQFEGNFKENLTKYSEKPLTSFAQLEPSKSSSAPPPPGGGGGGGGPRAPPRPPPPPGGPSRGAGGAGALVSPPTSLGGPPTTFRAPPLPPPPPLNPPFSPPLGGYPHLPRSATATPPPLTTPPGGGSTTLASATGRLPRGAAVPLPSPLGATTTAAAGGIGAGGATTATSLPLVSPFNSPSGATLAPTPTRQSAAAPPAATTLAPPPTKPSSAAATTTAASPAATPTPTPTPPAAPPAAAAVPLSSSRAAAVPLPSSRAAAATAAPPAAATTPPTKPSAAASPADTAAPLAAATTPTTTPPPPPPPGSPTKIIDAGTSEPRKARQLMITKKGEEFKWNGKNYEVLSGETTFHGYFKKMRVVDDNHKEYDVELDNLNKISVMHESGTPPGTPPTPLPPPTRPSAAAPPAATAPPLPSSAAGSTNLSTIVPDTLQNLITWIKTESKVVTETDQDKILKKRTDKDNSVKYIFLQGAENIGTETDKFDYARTLKVLDQYQMIKNTGGRGNDCLIISFLMSVSLEYRKLDYDQKYSIASKFRRITLPTLIMAKKPFLRLNEERVSEVLKDLKSTAMLKDDQIGILVNLYDINILSLESYKEQRFGREIHKDYPKAHRIVPDGDISAPANEFGLEIPGIIIINRGNFHYESVEKEPDQYIFSKDELNALYKSVMQHNKYFKLLTGSAPFPPSASSAVAATAANAAATSSASSAANAAATSPLALSAANAAATSAPSLLKNTQDNKYCTDNKPPFIRIDECKVGAYGYNEQTLDKYIMEHNIGKKVETIKGKRYLKAYRSEKMEWANENPLTRVGLYEKRMEDFFKDPSSRAIANASRPTTQAEWRLWGNEPSIGINLTTGIGGALTYGLQSLEQGNPFFSLKTFYIDIDKTQNVLSIITECTWEQITCDQEANTTYDLIVHQDPDNQEINILDNGRDKVKKITTTRYEVRYDGKGGDEYVKKEETIIMDTI